jgi:hypothetical protein
MFELIVWQSEWDGSYRMFAVGAVNYIRLVTPLFRRDDCSSRGRRRAPAEEDTYIVVQCIVMRVGQSLVIRSPRATIKDY